MKRQAERFATVELTQMDDREGGDIETANRRFKLDLDDENTNLCKCDSSMDSFNYTIIMIILISPVMEHQTRLHMYRMANVNSHCYSSYLHI